MRTQTLRMFNLLCGRAFIPEHSFRGFRNYCCEMACLYGGRIVLLTSVFIAWLLSGSINEVERNLCHILFSNIIFEICMYLCYPMDRFLVFCNSF
jgi:hypothetical protein